MDFNLHEFAVRISPILTATLCEAEREFGFLKITV
jgi:hypothetical protein